MGRTYSALTFGVKVFPFNFYLIVVVVIQWWYCSSRSGSCRIVVVIQIEVVVEAVVRSSSTALVVFSIHCSISGDGCCKSTAKVVLFS